MSCSFPCHVDGASSTCPTASTSSPVPATAAAAVARERARTKHRVAFPLSSVARCVVFENERVENQIKSNNRCPSLYLFENRTEKLPHKGTRQRTRKNVRWEVLPKENSVQSHARKYKRQ